MGTKTLQSLERGLDILFLFSAEKPILSLQEVAAALAVPPSTAYRLVATLCKKGVVARNPVAKGYELHPSLLRLQAALRPHLEIGRIALPALEELARSSRETSQLCLLQGHEIVCAEAVSSPNIIRFTPEKGRALPLHASALGRAILAFLPEAYLATYLRKVGLRAMTPHTVTDPAKLRPILGQIRAQGWAISFQQMFVGARGVAVPIFDGTHTAVASLGISGPHPRFTDRKARGLVRALQAHARSISKLLGAAADEDGRRAAR
jgi:DNA-binding IclR family transcriptional regulator